MKRENNLIRLPLVSDLVLTFCLTMSAQCPTKETETLDACIHDEMLNPKHDLFQEMLIMRKLQYNQNNTHFTPIVNFDDSTLNVVKPTITVVLYFHCL